VLTTLLLETALCSVLLHTTVQVSLELELELEDLGHLPRSDPAFPLAGEVNGAAEEDGVAEDGEEGAAWAAEADMVDENMMARKKLASQASKANRLKASAKPRVKSEKEERTTRKANALKALVAAEDIMAMAEVDPVDSEAEEDGDITVAMVMDHTDTEDLLPIHPELSRVAHLLLI
jgi:hypothetical protein